jgi:histidine ammonia-lyase
MALPSMIDADTLDRVARGREVVEHLAESSIPAYGVSTGFGALATVAIPPPRRAALQASLIRSHAAGTGPLVPAEVVRATMVLRLRTLASGLTGVRPVVVETLTAMLNAGITPAVRGYGSLGCSGDLAPLSHIALAALGEGAVVNDARRSACLRGKRWQQAGIEPLVLSDKEGLALINGTDGMLGMLALALSDLDDLFMTSDLSTAMSVEALLGTDRAFAEDLVALRPQPGQAVSARRLRDTWTTPRSSRATRMTPSTWSRMRTRCAARRRSPVPPGTPRLMPGWWRSVNSHP